MEDEKKTTDTDSYKILIDKIEAMEQKYANLSSKYDEVCAFNRALLDRKPDTNNTFNPVLDAAKAKFAAMLKGE